MFFYKKTDFHSMHHDALLTRFSILIILFFSSCQTDISTTPTTVTTYQKVAGETMGTTYHITYQDSFKRDFSANFDSLLVALNKEVNTYDSTSVISQFNQAPIGDFTLNNAKDFIANFWAARVINEITEGAFDPTVAPLVNYWGFGYTPKKPVTAVDSVKIDKILQQVGMDKVLLSEDNAILTKTVEGLKLDFGAIAKGYGVDMLGKYLEKNGVDNYLVEIGGEVRARGKNNKGEYWKVGINVPKEGADVNNFQTVVNLENRSLATSGNYRNFYEVKGVKYSHTIQPTTGFPERNTLLSASVFALDCTTADAYATAFMVMGIDKALALANQLKEVNAYFIVAQADGNMEVIESK